MYFEDNELPYKWNADKAEYEKIEGDYTTFIPKYNDEKPSDKQSRAQVENRLLDCLLSVLVNPLNISETRVPLDVSTDNVKDFLKYIDKKAKSKTINSITYLTPKFQSGIRKSLIGGKKGIGPFALSAAHHTLSQFVNLQFASDVKGMLSKYGIKTISGRVDNEFISILDWLSAMINAHVDTAKDPYIIRMNVVPYTYNMTAFLLRSGFGGKTFLFLPQSILKDMSEAAAKVTGYLDVDNSVSEFKRIEDATKEVYNLYRDKAIALATSEQKTKINALDLDKNIAKLKDIKDSKWLTENLKQEETFDWYYNQLIIAKAFDELSIPAKALSELTTLSQIDTKKFGNNFSMYAQFLTRIKKFLLTQKTFLNAADVFKDTFLMQKAINGIEKPIDIMRDKLLRTSDRFSYYRQLILDLTGNSSTTDEITIRNLNRYLETSIKNKFFKDKISKERAEQLLFGKTSIPSRLRQLKTDILSGKYPKLLSSDGYIHNPLLEMIDKAYKYDNVDLQLPDFIKFTANKSTDDTDNQLIISWEELLDLGNDPDYTEVGEFARDLVDYAYLTSGDNFGPNTLFAYVPNSYRNYIGYVNYMQDTETSGEVTSENMMDALRHLWFDDKLVPPVKFVTSTTDIVDGDLVTITTELPSISVKEESKVAVEIDGVKYGYPIMFTNTHAIANPELTNRHGLPLFPIIVKYKIAKSSDPKATMLYRLVGVQVHDVKYDSKGRATIEYKPVYRITNKLGVRYKGNILVDVDKTSILSQNNPFGWNMDNQKIINNTKADNPYVLRMKGLDEDGNRIEGESNLGKIVPYLEFKPLNNDVYNKPLESVINSLSPKGKPVSEQSNEVINIYAGTNENAELSNFAYRPFEQKMFDYVGNPYGDVSLVEENVVFNSVENAFQAYKVMYSPDYFTDEGMLTQEGKHLFLQIAKSTPAEAKKLGNKVNGLEKNNWDKYSYNLMHGFISESFEQNPEALQKLLDTGNATLTHSQDRGKWGTEFPRILMEVRDELRDMYPPSYASASANPEDYTNHSGGAVGSDTEWLNIGKEYGVTNQNHYYYGNKTPNGNVEISKEEYDEGVQHVLEANKTLNRKPEKYMNLLARNYAQVKNSDAVFAIGKLLPSGIVDGGTGWAVQMAIDSDKPVYLYDQETQQWFGHNANNEWAQIPTPVLTPNFAGIGTREINESGKQAIKDVYNKTFVGKENTETVKIPEQFTLEGYKQVRKIVPGTQVEVFNVLDIIGQLKVAEAQGGEITERMDIGSQLTDWTTTDAVLGVMNTLYNGEEVNDVLQSYIDRHPELDGTDFSELDNDIKISNILIEILKESGAFVKEDPNQLSFNFEEVEKEIDNYLDSVDNNELNELNNLGEQRINECK